MNPDSSLAVDESLVKYLLELAYTDLGISFDYCVFNNGEINYIAFKDRHDFKAILHFSAYTQNDLTEVFDEWGTLKQTDYYEAVWAQYAPYISDWKTYDPDNAAPAKSLCKWDGKVALEVAAKAGRLPDYGEAEFQYSQQVKEEAAALSTLKRTLREWPICSNGGEVTTNPSFTADILQIKWFCSCGK